MRLFVTGLMVISLIACKDSSSSSEAGPVAAANTDDQEEQTNGDNDDRPTGGQRSDDAKTFMDYCLEEPDDAELMRTVLALKDLVGEELCGVASGRLSRTNPIDLTFQNIKDLRPLRGLTSLRTLILSSNLIEDVSHLKALTGLNELVLNDNLVVNLDGLDELPRLQKLVLYNTNINSQSLDAVGQITSLRNLDLTNTDVSNISSLANLSNLRELSLRLTEVTDLSALSGLSNLQNLDISDSEVIDLSPIANLTNLTVDLTGIPLGGEDEPRTTQNCPPNATNPTVQQFCQVAP